LGEGDGKIALAEVNKYGDLKDGVRIEVDKFNLVVVKEVEEEIARRESESALEKGGQHHDFLCMRGGDFFILGRPPLNHGSVGEKVLLYEFQ
jgi:hypothetical protein